MSNLGGFIVSKNILSGVPVGYVFREKSKISELNGWNFYSEIDDQTYIERSENFAILSMESVNKFAPYMVEIFEAPYGTDLELLYEKDVFVGFYDLVKDREVEIEEIIKE